MREINLKVIEGVFQYYSGETETLHNGGRNFITLARS